MLFRSMAAEAGVLGVPFIRFNDFVGRIGYLKELEEKYQLGYGIPTKDVPLLYATLDALLSMPNRREVFGKRREEMLSDKIDFAAFLGWFLDNYPESKAIMRADNTYQYRFK